MPAVAAGFFLPELELYAMGERKVEAIRELARHTPAIVQRFSELAISYNINIIFFKKIKFSNTFNLC